MPEDIAGAIRQGNARFARADYRGALSAFRYALTRSPHDRAARMALALSLDQLGKFRQSLLLWTSLDAEAASSDPWILYFLGRNRLMQGDLMHAQKTGLKLARLLGTPDDEETKELLELNTLLLAITQHLQKNYPDSNANLDFLNTLNSRPPAIARLLACVNCHGLGNPACAIDRLRAAIKIDGTFQEARRLLADIQSAHGDFDNAYLEARIYMKAEQDPEYQKKFREFAKYTTAPAETLLKSRETGFSTAWPKDLSQILPEPGPTVKIGLWADAKGNPQTMSEASVMAGAPFTANLAGAGAVTKGNKNETLRLLFVSTPSAQVVLLQGNREIRLAKPLTLRPEEDEQGSFLIKGARPYREPVTIHSDLQVRSRLLVVPAKEGFYLVNELGLEDYLLGVLPAEIGGDSPREALRAQAVLARSYALWRKNTDRFHRQRDDPFDLCDQVHCQVYKGVLGETATAGEAVLETSGQALENEGAPFQIWYHASCGGISADTSARDWPNPQPPDLTALDPMQWTRYFETAAFKEQGEEWCFEQSSRSAWIRLISLDELDRKAGLNYPSIGRLKSAAIEERAPNGRIKKLRLTGSKSSRLIDEDYAIRLALAPGGLRSALTEMVPIYFGGHQRHLLFFGRGYGHGRGVCQMGAIRQGKKGVMYKDILKFYYPTAAVKKSY